MGSAGPYGPIVNGTQIVFYEYRPNKPAGYAFLVLFAIATLAHLVYFFVLRAWFFIPFLLGGISEVFGYYARAWASDEPDKVGPFLLQNLLILAAPPFLAATIYMSLGRVLTALGAQRHSLVKPSWITKIYVIIDFGCIVTQLVGSAILGSGDASAVTTSKTMILSGLIAQLVALSFFVVNCWHVYRRCASDPFLGSEKQDLSFVWQNHFRAIMLVALVMIVRSTVRMAEYLQGSDGFIASHEVFIYVFDAFPMLLVMIVFLVIHPGRLVRDARVELGKYNRASSGSIMLQNQTF